MNRIYKLKFDKRRNELVVVSEITAGVGKAKVTGRVEGERHHVVECAPWR